MKDELISRSALTERIVDLLVFEWGYEGIEESVRQIFSEIPAVDAETVIKSLPYVKEALEMAKQSLKPVVRCKDCKHMNMTGHFRWCKAWERIQTMGDEGFCNFGERRADNEPR